MVDLQSKIIPVVGYKPGFWILWGFFLLVFKITLWVTIEIRPISKSETLEPEFNILFL